MKKSGIAALLSGKPKADEEESEDELEMDDDGDDYSAAADELFDALKNDDREGFSTALKAAVMACKGS